MEELELMIQRPVIDKDNGIVINGNFEEVKAMVKAKVEQFKDLTLNEDNLKEVTAAKMQFTHLRTGIDREQKQYKALYITPMADNIKKLCDDIQEEVAKGESALQKQIDAYEQRRKDELTEILKLYISEAVTKYGLVAPYSEQFDLKKSYYNKGAKEEDTIKDIDFQAQMLFNRQKERLQAEEHIRKECEGTSLVAEQYIQLLGYGRTAFEILDMIKEAKEKAAAFNEELKKKAEEKEKVVIGEVKHEITSVEVPEEGTVTKTYQITVSKYGEGILKKYFTEMMGKLTVEGVLEGVKELVIKK